MQTNFTPAQLADPETALANDILRTCVHCGMCTATCPTFVTLGDELDSPRGRIYLIKDMLESGRPATGLFHSGCPASGNCAPADINRHSRRSANQHPLGLAGRSETAG